MTNPPKENVYSGVIDHESVRIGMLLAEHNGLEVMATNVGNAYLHGVTREKVYCWKTVFRLGGPKAK